MGKDSDNFGPDIDLNPDVYEELDRALSRDHDLQRLLISWQREKLLRALAHPLSRGAAEDEKLRLQLQASELLLDVERSFGALVKHVASLMEADTDGQSRRVAWDVSSLGKALRNIGLQPTLLSEVTAIPEQPQPQPVPVLPESTTCGRCGAEIKQAWDPSKPPGKASVVMTHCKCWQPKDPDNVEYVDHQRAFEASTHPRRRFTVLQGGGEASGKPIKRELHVASHDDEK